MNGYDHGDDRYRFPQHKITADFSSNVPETPPSEDLWDAISSSHDVLHRYPPPHPYSLEESIAELLGIPRDSVAVTSGATEAIYLVAHCYQAHHSLVAQPTFSEYASAAHLYGHKVSFCTIDEVGDALTSALAPNVVWICNPNNPTGVAYPHELLRQWMEQFPDLLFVVDQSYHAFTTKELLTPTEVVTLPNCLLIQSLTKSYAIPGLRLGYFVGHPTLVRSIGNYRMPWSVNALAIVAGQYLIHKPLPFSLTALLAERQGLVTALQQLDLLEIFPTDTHYFLARLYNHKAKDVKAWLVKEHGILVRDASTFPTLTSHYIRIATQSRVHNTLLVEALSHIPR